MLSRQLICRKMRVCWKVRIRPRRAISGTRSREISRPSKRIEPPSIGWVPTIELNSVVLPEPFGPIRPTIWPSPTVRLTLSLATTPP